MVTLTDEAQARMINMLNQSVKIFNLVQRGGILSEPMQTQMSRNLYLMKKIVKGGYIPVEERGKEKIVPRCSGCQTPTVDQNQEHPGICTCGGYITDVKEAGDAVSKV
jgi:hypothetical protein